MYQKTNHSYKKSLSKLITNLEKKIDYIIQNIIEGQFYNKIIYEGERNTYSGAGRNRHKVICYI